jgi:hypothetical protein
VEVFKIIISHFFIGMSSLAFYAAPIDNNDISTGNTQIEKKKISRNKTLKKKNSNSSESEHVKAMMDTIHKNAHEDENEKYMGNFSPPPLPDSAGDEKIDSKETPIQSYSEQDLPVCLEAFNTLESSQSDDYYKNVVPSYSGMNTPSQTQNDDLLNKLDQILHLLEEQNNERTGHVTEEIILYSFLGIFIIFVVDSFARVGKYVR